jgi:alkylation response protein AidB-like acyl-CoA dehydrogenase
MNVAAAVLRALGSSTDGDDTAVVWQAVTSGDPADAGIEAEIVGSTWRLSGQVDTVLWPERVSHLLVVVRSKPIAGRDRGVRVYRIPVDADGCAVEPRPLLGADARRVRLDRVEMLDRDAVGPPRDAAPALGQALDRLCIEAVAEMVDLAQQALDQAVAWVNEREQFGAALATRQAVQHRAADMAMAVAAVQGLVDDARAAAAHGPCAVAATIAKLVASDRLPDVTASAHQLHGGEGYYADRGLHVLHKRVCTLAMLFGSGSHQRARLARLLAE